MMALLGLLAYKAFKGLTGGGKPSAKTAAPAPAPAPTPPPARAPGGTVTAGMPGNLNDLLKGGLGGLLFGIGGAGGNGYGAAGLDFGGNGSQGGYGGLLFGIGGAGGNGGLGVTPGVGGPGGFGGYYIGGINGQNGLTPA